MKIYPNPTNGVLEISNPTIIVKEVSVDNMLGILVSNSLNILNQANGIYLVKNNY